MDFSRKRKYDDFNGNGYGYSSQPRKKLKASFYIPISQDKPREKKPIPMPRRGFFKKKGVLVTGQFVSWPDRRDLKNLIKELGGEEKLQPSGNVHIAVVGTGPSKAEKIRKKNEDLKKRGKRLMKVYNEEEFLKLLERGVDKTRSDEKFNFDDFGDRFDSSDEEDDILKKFAASEGDELWTEKHCPKTSKSLVGNVQKISFMRSWLKNWVKYGNPGKNSKNALLVHGVPGIGKSTAAQLLCKELGFEVIELNSSDKRSGKAMKSVFGDVLKSYTMGKFKFFGKTKRKRACVIMEEVDGAFQSGGKLSLKNFIKETKIPMICICNEARKLETLKRVCLEVKFSRPNKNHVSNHLMKICEEENLFIERNALLHMVEEFDNDVRGVLNQLQFLKKYQQENSLPVFTYNDVLKMKMGKTNMDSNLFEITREILLVPSPRTIGWYLSRAFSDDIIKFFVFQNYLSTAPFGSTNSMDYLSRMNLAAENFSLADTIERTKLYTGQWGLGVHSAIHNVVAPSFFMKGHYQKHFSFEYGISFPSILGKISSTSKHTRIAREVSGMSMQVANGGGQFVALFDYSVLVLRRIIDLVKRERCVEAARLMGMYGISKEILEDLMKIVDFDKTEPKRMTLFKLWKSIPTKKRTSFTRFYKKEGLLKDFQPKAKPKSKRTYMTSGSEGGSVVKERKKKKKLRKKKVAVSKSKRGKKTKRASKPKKIDNYFGGFQRKKKPKPMEIKIEDLSSSSDESDEEEFVGFDIINKTQVEKDDEGDTEMKDKEDEKNEVEEDVDMKVEDKNDPPPPLLLDEEEEEEEDVVMKDKDVKDEKEDVASESSSEVKKERKKMKKKKKKKEKEKAKEVINLSDEDSSSGSSDEDFVRKEKKRIRKKNKVGRIKLKKKGKKKKVWDWRGASQQFSKGQKKKKRKKKKKEQ